MVLAAGDTALGVSVAGACEKHPTRFLFHGSSYARDQGPREAAPSELDENYVPLHFHGTVAVFDHAARFHAVIPIESGIVLFPRLVHESDVPLLSRWARSAMERSMQTSIWVTGSGDSYNEQTMHCSPRLKRRV